MRMHLVARVPSDGAHRLAWWIGQQPDHRTAFDRLASRMGSFCMMIERLLSGEVRPEINDRLAIMAITRGAVQPSDWDRATKAWWFDMPAQRRAGGASAMPRLINPRVRQAA
jgi:hypothetical protein